MGTVYQSRHVFRDLQIKLVNKLFSNKTLKLNFVTLVSMRMEKEQ